MKKKNTIFALLLTLSGLTLYSCEDSAREIKPAPGQEEARTATVGGGTTPDERE